MGVSTNRRAKNEKDEYRDLNARPWIVEEIVKGNCSLTWQAKFAILSRRFSRKPKLVFRHGENSKHGLSWTIVQTKGYRGYQEDRCIAGTKILAKALNSATERKQSESGVASKSKDGWKDDCDSEFILFGVFDGHGQPGEGHRVSEFTANKFSSLLQRRLDFEDDSDFVNINPLKLKEEKIDTGSKRGRMSRNESKKDDGGENIRKSTVNAVHEKVKRFFSRVFEGTCRDIDTALRINMPTCATHNGTTMCSLLVGKNTSVFANCGDSRGASYEYTGCVDKLKLTFTTFDHKPTRLDEAQRIQRAGGWVQEQRVNGDLAVSRTIGDLEYKPRGAPLRLCPVSNQPKVDVIPRNKVDCSPTEEIFLLATDGLWDAISTVDALAFIKARIREYENSCDKPVDVKASLEFALRKLIRFVSIKRLSSDNISIILISRTGSQSVGASEHSVSEDSANKASPEIIPTSTHADSESVVPSVKEGSQTEPLPDEKPTEEAPGEIEMTTSYSILES